MMGYDDDDGEGSRLFEHRASDAHRMVPKSELVVYNPRKEVFGLQMYSWSKKGIIPDPGSLVVYIDGACRNNGTPSARGSWGVYFGPGSQYNHCGLLASDLPQTNSRAEIEALVKALDSLHEITSRDYSLSKIKIATDSEYLANAMSLWIGDWIENDGINARGHKVAHFETLKDLHERLDDMTYGDDGGLEIMFWPIPREENLEADKLANQAFQ
ncbi:NAD dependent epimerase [Colletotrichum tofieldiae]|nr:NAD dependent epimerase [Colletotrichum tofieldiae]GKT78390.1 NAD dependent epimerase [Colletotrichum tofieldiae]